MADVISRLKLESGEFDSKIKRAAQGIQRMAEECHNAGGILNQLEDENRAYIQSLGSMATVATTAKGKLAELTAAFTDIRSQYNALSDEEKQGEFGQELNRQLEIMKGRINDAKTELSDINKELGNTGKQSQETGGFLDKLKDRFVVNLDAMNLFELGLKAVKGAMGMAKDAFMASEANIDEWGRTTAAAEAAYDGFLYAINTGDISGYLGRIDEIKKAAVEAYNELDRLSTQKAINNRATQGQRVENERMRTMLRTGRYIAPADGRASTPGLKDGDKLSQKQLAAIAKQLFNGQQSLNKFIRDDIKQAGKSIDALYKREAATLGLSLKEFRKGTSNMDEFDKRIAGYHAYMKWEREHTATSSGNSVAGGFTISSRTGGKNPYQQYAAWGVFQDDGETFTAINNLINERAGYQSQLYSNAASNYRAINRANNGGGGGRRRSRRAAAPYVPQTEVLLIGIDMPWWQRSITSPQMQGSISMLDIDPSLKMQSPAWVQRGQKNPEITRIADTMDESAKLFSDINGGISSIVTGVETLGIEMPEGMKKMLSMVQGVTTILSGISALMLIFNAHQTTNTLTNIATAVGATAMHRGGVVRAATGTTVPGNYGFDAVPALLTSGETVLTRAQAGNLASQLQQGSKGESTMQPYTTGEYVYLGVKNHLKRNGQGEIVTTGMLRRMGLIV